MSFTLYLVGFIVFITGLAYGAHMMHVAPRWIAAGSLVLVGVGIVSAVGPGFGRWSVIIARVPASDAGCS